MGGIFVSRVLRIGTVLDPVDVTVGKTHRSQDDLAFIEARKKRKNQKTVTRPIPTGPCCARCRHWMAGDDDDEGECRAAFVMISFNRPETRLAIDYDQYRDDFPAVEALVTRAWFTCGQVNRDLTEKRIRPNPDAVDLDQFGRLKRLLRERERREHGGDERG